MIDTAHTTLLDLCDQLDRTATGRKQAKRSVAKFGRSLNRIPTIDDLSHDAISMLANHLCEQQCSRKLASDTTSDLRGIWRLAYSLGLTEDIPPAGWTRHRPRPLRRQRSTHNPNLRTPFLEPLPDITVNSTLLDVWRHFCHARFANSHPKSREHYRSAVRKFQEFLSRVVTVSDLTDDRITAIQDWAITRGYSESTSANLRYHLRALWNHLHQEGIRDDLPENARPVNVPPQPAVDITNALEAHRAARQAEQCQQRKPAKPMLGGIRGMFKRMVNPQSPSPIVPPAAPPAPDRNPDTITVSELIAAWRVHAKREGISLGEIANVNYAFQPIEMLYGRELAKDFGPKKLKEARERMVDGYSAGDRKCEGLSRGTINRNVGRIKLVFKWGVSEELVPAAVHQALSTVGALRAGRTNAREMPPVTPVDDTVVDATLPHLPPVVADMVRFQRLTSCRPGEVCIIRPCDVDRSGDVWVYRPPQHKTLWKGKSRAIFIGPRAQLVLSPYLERDAELYCFSPRESELWRRHQQRLARKTPVQPSQIDRSKANPRTLPGKVYVRNEYAKAIRRACKAHGLPHWKPNQLRHTGATEIRKLFGLEAAQVLLGHSRADVTQVYAEKNEAVAIEVARQIG